MSGNVDIPRAKKLPIRLVINLHSIVHLEISKLIFMNDPTRYENVNTLKNIIILFIPYSSLNLSLATSMISFCSLITLS
jgi:hypothetical protein